ncbi:MAG: hypothetical protein NZ959_12050 [Armatimonadetes bacterium]|nr:hypothetical protein [Armatimonadota bacterium]
MGCFLGCGMVMLFFAVFALGLFIYLMVLVPEFPTHRIIAPNQPVIAYAKPDPTDPGLQELAQRLSERWEGQSRQELPEWLRNLSPHDTGSQQSLIALLPTEMTVIFDGQGSLQRAAAVNGGAQLRLIRFIGTTVGGWEKEYKGARYMTVRHTYAFGFYGATLLWAESEPLFQQLVDRLEKGQTSAPPMVTHLKGSYDLVAFLRPHASFWRQWGLLGLSAEIGCDVVSGDRMTMDIYCPSVPDGWLSAVRSTLEELSRKMKEEGVTLRWTIKREGEGLFIVGELSGLTQFVNRRFFR